MLRARGSIARAIWPAIFRMGTSDSWDAAITSSSCAATGRARSDRRSVVPVHSVGSMAPSSWPEQTRRAAPVPGWSLGYGRCRNRGTPPGCGRSACLPEGEPAGSHGALHVRHASEASRLSPSGKVDRGALAAASGKRPKGGAHLRGAWHARSADAAAGAWAEVLRPRAGRRS